MQLSIQVYKEYPTPPSALLFDNRSWTCSHISPPSSRSIYLKTPVIRRMWTPEPLFDPRCQPHTLSFMSSCIRSSHTLLNLPRIAHRLHSSLTLCTATSTIL